MRPLSAACKNVEDALENGEDAAQVLKKWLPKVLRSCASFSGKTQSELALDMAKSPSYVQKLLSLLPLSSFPLPNQVETAFGIPSGMFDNVDDFVSFHNTNRVYVATLDALLETYPSGGAKVRLAPSQFVLLRLEKDADAEEAHPVLTNVDQDELYNYFTNPSKFEEPEGTIIRKLERLLGLPKGSVSDPEEFAETKNESLIVERKLKQTVAENVAKLLTHHGLSAAGLAKLAAVPESAVHNMLHQGPHPCSLRLVSALAVALAVPVQRLFAITPEDDESEMLAGSFFEGLPKNATAFITAYVNLVKDRDASGPTVGAQAALLLTPLLGQSFEWFGLAAKNLPAGTNGITDLGSLLAGVEQRMRLAR